MNALTGNKPGSAGGDAENSDEELDVTQVERSTVCPISKSEMVNPVKHIPCGHVYDKESIAALMKNSGKKRCFCPMIGCPYPNPIQRTDLVLDTDLLKFIRKKQTQ
ncbi:E3 SUMO-protein ligase NSE2 [Eurytemora carolleeae]|uniref:E3 SUMO-protein ligase NSE2 n=1 Tax=Eurytemora carolleeae TaxID=1294199 RepID=UPI000C767F1F|nr:E3 SUMO-protein ligase NSE2 [Eurytemora carolleeae]XP_023328695.1 E3 SUMO-protein ligase NSE2 [Eurytemora carolleeae]XP_023328771.1 E3 SUMO-protein ligase NSE2 [Eurytemora carolleeae]|eukprot:XP_023328614.1 E3 SUMO-protein ligase NSE2-like [Eurytemora affinis]